MANAPARMSHTEDALSTEDARAYLQLCETIWGKQDIEAILPTYDDHTIVRFGEIPEIRGKAPFEQFLRSRFTRRLDYRIKKTLKAVEGSTVVGTWVASWTDAVTGKRMEGRGVEVMVLRDGKCIEWDAAFNGWEQCPQA